jgi:hypothetical protein
MRWPWVSRLAYDTVAAERDWLRTDVERLQDALTRISRREVGLPEAPREVRPQVEPMPAELAQYVLGFANPETRRMAQRGLYEQRLKTGSWQRVMENVTRNAAQTEEDA